MNLLTNTNPGKPRWWAEYYIYKLTGRCRHLDGWVQADSDCKLAWDVEYDYVRHPASWVEEDA